MAEYIGSQKIRHWRVVWLRFFFWLLCLW